jgi:TolA-binding protein
MKAYAMVPLKLYNDARHELQAFLSRDPKGKNAEQAQSLLAQVSATGDTTIAAAH